MNTQPTVAIILLNWNRPHFTLACLESLYGLDYPLYEVVVVDNGSDDNSVALIRERFPNATLIENGSNLGFAGGNNVGIAYAMARGVEYILLLNDDTEVAASMLRELVDVAESDIRIGALGPKIYYYDQANIIWSGGGTINRFGQPRHLRANQVDVGERDCIQDVDYVTGCAIMVRRAVVETVGPLDCRFFAYFEETEWCARIVRAGYRIVYAPRARMWHKISMEARTTSRRYLYLMTRNRLLYLRLTRRERSDNLTGNHRHAANSGKLVAETAPSLHAALRYGAAPRHS